MKLTRLNLDEIQPWTALTAAIVATHDGDVVQWSEEGELLFGYTGKEAGGCKLAGLKDPTNAVEKGERMRELALPAEPAAFEALRCRKDGALVFVEVVRERSRTSEAGVPLLVLAERDVTRIRFQR